MNTENLSELFVPVRLSNTWSQEIRDFVAENYRVNKNGVVISLLRKKTKRIKPGYRTTSVAIYKNTKHVYQQIRFKHPDRQVSVYLAQVVLFSFDAEALKKYNNRTCKLVVDHIDNNPSNNNLENLQVLTNAENVKKGYAYKKFLASLSTEAEAA